MKTSKPKLSVVPQLNMETKNLFDRGDRVIVKDAVFPFHNFLIPVRVLNVLANTNAKVLLSNLQSYEPGSLEKYDPADYICD